MMAMPPIVEEYATAVVGADAVAEAKAPGGDEALEAVLALVNSDDEKSFGSAAWFYSECSDAVKMGVQEGSEEGWHAFLTECVKTTAAPERDEPWVAAKAVLLE